MKMFCSSDSCSEPKISTSVEIVVGMFLREDNRSCCKLVIEDNERNSEI